MEKELQNPDEAQRFTRLPGHDYKRIILLVSIVLIILAIPLVIYFIQQNQDTRQRADSAGYAGTTRKAVLSGDLSSVPEFNKLCQDAGVSPCKLDVASQYKAFDSDDASNPLYNTEFLTAGNQYVELKPAGSAAAGQGYGGSSRENSREGL